MVCQKCSVKGVRKWNGAIHTGSGRPRGPPRRVKDQCQEAQTAPPSPTIPTRPRRTAPDDIRASSPVRTPPQGPLSDPLTPPPTRVTYLGLSHANSAQIEEDPQLTGCISASIAVSKCSPDDAPQPPRPARRGTRLLEGHTCAQGVPTLIAPSGSFPLFLPPSLPPFPPTPGRRTHLTVTRAVGRRVRPVRRMTESAVQGMLGLHAHTRTPCTHCPSASQNTDSTTAIIQHQCEEGQFTPVSSCTAPQRQPPREALTPVAHSPSFPCRACPDLRRSTRGVQLRTPLPPTRPHNPARLCGLPPPHPHSFSSEPRTTPGTRAAAVPLGHLLPRTAWQQCVS